MKVSYFFICGVIIFLTSHVAHAAIDPARIPLGDGKTSTTAPQVGYVYRCSAGMGGGGGASESVPWIKDGTWDSTTKLKVQGSVAWPAAAFTMSLSGGTRTLSGNGLPVGLATGVFPIATTDPAYTYDRNPNTIAAQIVQFSLPGSPVLATTPGCLSGGTIGIMNDGVVIFNALDAPGRDAGAHEIQDACDGHPEVSGSYHHHTKGSCIPNVKDAEAVVGYALDGFGITSGIKSDGTKYVNADLDVCHGMTSEIMWDGAKKNMYHYVLTDEYPYSVGCYRGTVTSTGGAGSAGGMMRALATTPTAGRGAIATSGAAECITGQYVRTLATGAQGSDVSTLQKFLVSFGYLMMPQGVAYGYFGNLTKNAVMQFQKDKGVEQVGTFGMMSQSYADITCLQSKVDSLKSKSMMPPQRMPQGTGTSPQGPQGGGAPSQAPQSGGGSGY